MFKTMKKLLILIVIVAIGLVIYFWKGQSNEVVLPQAELAPEDQAIAQELQDVSTADLEAEFKEIDAALNEL